jgi:hypothetical protein
MNKQRMLDALRVFNELAIDIYLEDYTDVYWTQDSHEIRWIFAAEEYNTDWLKSYTEECGLLIANIADGCGNTITQIFDIDKKLSEEDFEVKLQEEVSQYE